MRTCSIVASLAVFLAGCAAEPAAEAERQRCRLIMEARNRPLVAAQARGAGDRELQAYGEEMATLLFEADGRPAKDYDEAAFQAALSGAQRRCRAVFPQVAAGVHRDAG